MLNNNKNFFKKEEDVMVRNTIVMDWKTQKYLLLILPRLIYIFNTILIKIWAEIFIATNKLNLNFYGKTKNTLNNYEKEWSWRA